MRRGLRIGNGVNLGWPTGLPMGAGAAADTTRPSVVITSTESSPTSAQPIPLTFTFSEVVTGFAVGDITVGAGGSIGNFAGSGAVYTADLTVTTAGATITVDVAANVCVDGAGNQNTAATQFVITSSIYLYDAFTRADSNTTLGSAPIGGAWTALAGTWGISTNKGYLVSNTGQAVAVLDVGHADASFSVDLTTSATTNRIDCGIVLRVIDNSNYLLVVFNKITTGNKLILYKQVTGGFVALVTVDPAGLAENTTYSVLSIMSGSDITIKVNGTTRISYTLSGAEAAIFNAATKVGIRVNYDTASDDKGARFDNLKANP